MKRSGKIAIVCACAALVGITAYKTVDMQLAPKFQMQYEATMEVLTFEESAMCATHIVDAVYIGKYQTQYGEELMFRPETVLKGAIDPEKEPIIYVQPFISDESQEVEYVEENTYLLLLEKNCSVYYEHDQYVQIGQVYISSEDQTRWEQFHARIPTSITLDETQGETSYGVEFTKSDNVSEIVNVAENIFVVNIEGIYAESEIAPTTVYRCSVVKTIRNMPVEQGNILITLFNDTVEIGQEYLVLLADATQTAPVYTLAAKNGVYGLEEVENSPVLTALLDTATEYHTVIVEKSEQDILREEAAYRSGDS